MTTKEKAEELFNQYANVIYQRALTQMQYEICKQCALIAVNEILNEYREDYESIDKDIFTIYSWWQEVKQEIEKL